MNGVLQWRADEEQIILLLPAPSAGTTQHAIQVLSRIAEQPNKKFSVTLRPRVTADPQSLPQRSPSA